MIQARGVRKRFGRHEVLRGIDLALAPGEVAGLIGANGAGKTTLMSCLLSMEASSRGRKRCALPIAASSRSASCPAATTPRT